MQLIIGFWLGFSLAVWAIAQDCNTIGKFETITMTQGYTCKPFKE